MVSLHYGSCGCIQAAPLPAVSGLVEWLVEWLTEMA